MTNKELEQHITRMATVEAVLIGAVVVLVLLSTTLLMLAGMASKL